MKNKHLDVTHIDFKFGDAASSERVIFFKHIKNEFELRKWGFEGGSRQIFIKLKQSKMNVMKVRILRGSIKRVKGKRDTFLFGMELGVLYILHLENRISEKIVAMILLEGLCHCPTGVGTKAYFNDLEIHLNNGILAEKNSNWVIPTEGDKL